MRNLLVIASLFLIIICFFLSGSFATFTSLVVFYVVMNVIIFGPSCNRDHKSELFRLFNISFISYVILSIFSYLSFVEINDFFIFSDQEEFFDYGEELGKSSSIYQIFNLCFIERVHYVNEGVIFYFGLLAYLANLIDGNTLFYQIINVCYFGILINIFVYKTLLFYTNKNEAYKYSIYYALFSHIPVFSIWLLRDIHIAFFFSVAIYILHFSFKLRNLFFLLLLFIVVFEFRLVTGIAFLFFPIIYSIKGIWTSKSKFLYSIVAFLIFSFTIYKFSDQLFYSYLTLVEGFEHYSEYSIEVADDQGGLGGLLLKLPVLLKQTSILVYSQISPFPIWDQFVKSNTFIQYFFGVIFMLSPLFWGFIFYFVVVKLFSSGKKLRFFQVVLLFFLLIFLLGNSSNLNLRRIIAVYPIIYCIFVFYVTRSFKSNIRVHIMRYSFIYSFLVLIYIFLKFFIF
jgi:hypothetical protein